MNDLINATPAPRKLWVRVLLMVLLSCAFQLAASVLLVVAVLQVILALASDSSNTRLHALGHSLGLYLAQIADFVSFASEVAPFPFSDWPS